MTLRGIVVFVIGGVLGLIGGFAVGIFVYPYVFLADIVATETVNRDAKTIVATGTFIHANPSDPVHFGSGKVTVFRDSVFLDEDFKVGPGPKFHVYLVPDAEVHEHGLGDFQGSQNYPLPTGVDPARYKNVVVWCEHFGVLISPAKLIPAKG